MKNRPRRGRALLTGLCLVSACSWLRAEPINPARDDEVIEVLPAVSSKRSEERRMRKALALRPRNAALAVAVARRQLEQARALGDPRFAGLALSAIGAWSEDATTPSAVLLMKATLQQYLHQFDDAVRSLRVLVARPTPQPQAWLTLATIERVQGKYTESDAACREVGRSGATLHASACLAENAALRGHTTAARKTLTRLLAEPGLPQATRVWLLTTVAELEQRDGHAQAADAAFREVLQLEADTYAAVAYADFLIEQQRPLDALNVLKNCTRTNVVVLRLAIAGTRAQAASAAHDVADMRERIALANERPDARIFHGREQAMFALQVEHKPRLALELIRGDLRQQREPLDLLVFAQAARASGAPDAVREARALRNSVGLHDRRIDALL